MRIILLLVTLSSLATVLVSVSQAQEEAPGQAPVAENTNPAEAAQPEEAALEVVKLKPEMRVEPLQETEEEKDLRELAESIRANHRSDIGGRP